MYDSHGQPRGNLHAPTRQHMTRWMLCYMATRFLKRMMGWESLSLQHVGWCRPVHDCSIHRHLGRSNEAGHAHVPIDCGRTDPYALTAFAGRDSLFHRRHRCQPPRFHHKSSPRPMDRALSRDPARDPEKDVHHNKVRHQRQKEEKVNRKSLRPSACISFTTAASPPSRTAACPILQAA